MAERLQVEFPSLSRVVSFTTRAIRPLEAQGVDYHFVAHDEFNTLMLGAGGMLDVAYVSNEKYGITNGSIDDVSRNGKIPLLVVDPAGGLRISKKRDSITIFLAEQDIPALEKRMTARGDSSASIRSRIAGNVSDMSYAEDYMYIIPGQSLAGTVLMASSLIRRELGMEQE